MELTHVKLPSFLPSKTASFAYDSVTFICSCLTLQDRRLMTGSTDHTLKVVRADTGASVYTLHGHTGPITAIFIDRWQLKWEDLCNVYRILVFRHNTVTAGSASQDGMLCVWDLLTGACMYSVQVSEGLNQIPIESNFRFISLHTCSLRKAFKAKKM